MIFEFTDYRSYLKAVLVERISQNSSYSLRAMSRDLGVAPSVLTNVFKRKRNFSLNRSHELARRLDLSREQADYFSLLVQLDSTKSVEDKDRLLERLRVINPKGEISELSVDAFKFISDWYHIPILEMTTLHDFDFSTKMISNRLGISEMEASTAVERLRRLELIETDSKGKTKRTYSAGVFESKERNTALRHFHKQMLLKAIESLETQNHREKWVGSETFAFDAVNFDKAAEITEAYMQEMIHLANSGESKTKIYHLSVQFFNLMKGRKT